MSGEIHDLARRLGESIEAVAIALLGEPTMRGRLDWRYGRKGSLSIVVSGERRGRWYDHGAAEGGDALALVRRKHGGDLRAAIEWGWRFVGEAAPWPARAPRTPASVTRSEPLRWSTKAAAIWDAAELLLGTLAETYLVARIGDSWASIRDTVAEADALRFLPARGDRAPAMVAKVTDARNGDPMTLHFTRLAADGRGKADDGRPPKLLLGGHAKAGGVVRLVPDDSVTMGLGIAEGIETGLAVLSSGWAPVWACIDAGNVSAFPVLSGIEALSVFADHDDAGMRAAQAAVRRWRDAGRQAAIVTPPTVSADWADEAVA